MSKLVRLTYLLLFVALSAVASDENQDVYVGEVLEVSQDGIELDQGYSTISIGFFGEPAVLAHLDKVKVGDKVRTVFGSGIPPGGQRSINKLLEIRLCLKEDAACDADRKAGEAQDAIEKKARAASEKRQAECREAMHETLLEDPRYAQSSEVNRSDSDKLLSQVNSFKGPQKVCSNRVMHDHSAAVYDACKLHHCGDNIGGGCAHIAGYALSDAAIERAILVCKDK